MKTYEKLGAFYLGRPVAGQDDPEPGPLLYDAEGPDDPCGVRGHDWQRQDRALRLAARGSRPRVLPIGFPMF